LADGKRDNKSYYLLNGAARWSKIRRDSIIDYIQDPTPTTLALAAVLDAFQADAFQARDSFDDAAQLFVPALAKLVKLQPGLPGTAKEFNAVATELSAQLKARAPLILEAGQIAVNNIKAYQATL